MGDSEKRLSERYAQKAQEKAKKEKINGYNRIMGKIRKEKAMQKADYDLIWKKGRLTIDERSRLEKEVEQGCINLPDTDIASFGVLRTHKQMKDRLASEWWKIFIDAERKLRDCGDHIEEIRAARKKYASDETDRISAEMLIKIISEIYQSY